MRRLIALGVVGAIVVALVVAQLVLPGVAARHLRSQLSRSGTVQSVQVSAFPAIQLLWHHADTVTIRMGSCRQSSGRTLGPPLGQAADVGRLDASAQEFQDGLLRVHDARLRKDGDQLVATGRIDEADLCFALTTLRPATPVASDDHTLTL